MNVRAYSAWALAEPMITTGPRAAGTVTLADLASKEGHAVLLQRVLPMTEGRRTAALTVVHYAVAVVVDVLVGPLLIDGVGLSAEADQLGAVLDRDGSWVAFWAGSTVDGGSARSVGSLAAELLQPVLATSAQVARLGVRGVRLIAYEAIRNGVRRFERFGVHPSRDGWGDALLAATGLGVGVPERTVTVHPDGGAVVVLPVPSVCCVHSTEPSCHACPTCPLHAEDERPRIVEEFLRSLDDDGFHYYAGRVRV